MLQPPNITDTTPYERPLDPIAPLRVALSGRYEIEREIGQGAFATVYLALDLKHERKVAIKVLNADPTSETGELRFIREIRLLARLQHPNILPLHDSGHVEALLYYVTPFVSGETLRNRIDREKQLPIDAACGLAREVGDALAYAHAEGIIHRDIKPENILLSTGHPIIADFGVARAIDMAGVRQLTRTGMGSPGTPAYMSPEQLLGDRRIDGRSDTYSLGCVLYEMLAGKPPFAGKEGFVKRFTEGPPSVRTLRRDLPDWVDGVLAVSMARNPDERYQTTQEFVTALCGPEKPKNPAALSNQNPTATSVTLPAKVVMDAGTPLEPAKPLRPEPLSTKPRRDERYFGLPISPDVMRRPRPQVYAAVATVLLVVFLGAAAALRNRQSALASAIGFGPAIDSSKLAVIPFGGTAPLTDRRRLAYAVAAQLTEWRDLKIAAGQDLAAGPQEAPATVREAANLARHAGAGRFIWGRLDAERPGQARAELYDLASELPLTSVTIRGTGDTAVLEAAANALLQVRGRPPSADGGDGRTTSYNAWRMFGLGHVALVAGHLNDAESAFRAAITSDADFGAARVWLAQTLEWETPSDRQIWRDEAAHALQAKSGLAYRDRAIAVALTQLADKRYPEACGTYTQLVRADSLDFFGLYGLAQCKAFDSLVITSSSSPSGWRFRSRYSEAADFYMRALDVNPNAHSILSFEQLQELLPIGPTKTRRGRNIAGDEFAGFPLLDKNAVVFVPYPLQAFSNLRSKNLDRSHAAALAHDLDELLDFASGWTRHSPQNASAFRALAAVLEARGEIARGQGSGPSAIDAIETARKVARNSRDAILAATDEAWLLLKQGQFRPARILSDSLLAENVNAESNTAEALVGLAALTGKINRMSELSRRFPMYAAGAAQAPIAVLDAAAPYFAFAALGVCSDSVRVLEERLDAQIGHFVAEDQREQIAAAVKTRSRSMLSPCTAGKSSLGLAASGSRVLRMQQALALNDKAALRRMLAGVAESSRSQRPGDISLDFTYQLAWLTAAVGDTAAAAAELDRALGGLAGLSAASIREPASAAAVGRSMALRAFIAAARGESAEKTKWAQSLADLWATADAPLQPVVARMRALVATRSNN
jgi:eukaryotic-like serine/threonine-protein kinase